MQKRVYISQYLFFLLRAEDEKSYKNMPTIITHVKSGQTDEQDKSSKDDTSEKINIPINTSDENTPGPGPNDENALVKTVDSNSPVDSISATLPIKDNDVSIRPTDGGGTVKSNDTDPSARDNASRELANNKTPANSNDADHSTIVADSTYDDLKSAADSKGATQQHKASDLPNSNQQSSTIPDQPLRRESIKNKAPPSATGRSPKTADQSFDDFNKTDSADGDLKSVVDFKFLPKVPEATNLSNSIDYNLKSKADSEVTPKLPDTSKVSNSYQQSKVRQSPLPPPLRQESNKSKVLSSAYTIDLSNGSNTDPSMTFRSSARRGSIRSNPSTGSDGVQYSQPSAVSRIAGDLESKARNGVAVEHVAGRKRKLTRTNTLQ